MSSRTVCQILEATYSIRARPGRKAECPFCHNPYFFVRKDDTLGKCFHPPCGRYLTAQTHDSSLRRGLYGVLDEVFRDCHAALLSLPERPYPKDAYQYLTHERAIHPHVIRDSMLGIVPTDYITRLNTLWQPLLDNAKVAVDAGTGQKKPGRPKKEKGFSPKDWLTFLEEAKDKLRDCFLRRAGWLMFFYTDAYHRIVAIRFRLPYSRNFVYWKPFSSVAGLFGHGLFSPYQDPQHVHLNDQLIVDEGELNNLQLQSLFVRQALAKGKTEWSYLFVASVGGVENADFRTMQRAAKTPIINYDNDPNQAGLTLLEKAREVMSVTAFTTPSPHKDLDAYIRSFGQDYAGAWDAVKRLVAQRQPYPRIYSGTGREFLRDKIFIPKLLAEAILERHQFHYAAETL
jgi:hypothetical protein